MMSVGAVGGPGALAARWGGWILLALGLVFWAIVVVSTIRFVDRGATLAELQFGFGPYVGEMLRSGRFADCSRLSTGGQCDHAARLPLLVWLAASLGKVSANQMIATVLKDAIFAALSVSTLAWMWRRLPATNARLGTWLAVGVVLVVGLPVAKHAGQMNYEEGLGIPLLFLLGVFGPAALRDDVHRRIAVAFLCFALATASMLYLLKASYLFLLVVMLVAAIVWGVRRRAALVLVAAGLALLAPLSWGLHNKLSTDRFSIMTSYDGENLHLGWNRDTAAIYPWVAIDRVFDSPRAVLPDGSVVAMEAKPTRETFKDEWAWNDLNRAVAFGWIGANPATAFELALRKAYNYFVYVGKTPLTYAAEGLTNPTSSVVQDAFVSIWLLSARLMLAAFFAGCAVMWFRQPGQRGAVAVAAALAVAYAVPMVVGFNFERHVTAGLVLSLGSVLAIGPEAFEALQRSVSHRRARST